MQISSLLSAVGLTDKEAALYLLLLEFGPRPTSFLAKKANLNRGTAYLSLHSLLDKGLVTKSVRRKLQHFSALDPHRLIELAESRREESENAAKTLKQELPYLLALSKNPGARPRIQFFEGREGARFVMDQTLRAEDKTLQAFLSLADASAFLGAEWLESYTRERIRKGYTLLAIRTLEKDKQAMQENVYARAYVTSKVQHREVRYAPEDLAFPVTMYLFDQKIGVLSSKEEDFALLIESRELSQMHRKLFLLLWNELA